MIACYRWVLAVLLLSASTLSGCASLNAASIQPLPVNPVTSELPTAPPEGITVAAAASMQFAFIEIKTLFESQTGYRVNLVYGSTGQLVQQIENGAPYDLIASANTGYVDRLASQNLVLPGSMELYAQGQIVLAANRASGVDVTDLGDLLSEDVRHIAIANPEHAPYGLAAQQALQASGVWEQVQDKIVYAENIRQALQYVQSGDAQAGIVALGEANVPEISWTLVDSSLYEPLNQALGVIAASRHSRIARQFAEFVTGSDGQAVLNKYGFIEPSMAGLDQPAAIP